MQLNTSGRCGTNELKSPHSPGLATDGPAKDIKLDARADRHDTLYRHCTSSNLWVEVFNDVGRAVVGHVLTLDSDSMRECLGMAPKTGRHKLS